MTGAELVVQDLQDALDGLGGLVDRVLEVLRGSAAALAQGLLELSVRTGKARIGERQQGGLDGQLMLQWVANPLKAKGVGDPAVWHTVSPEHAVGMLEEHLCADRTDGVPRGVICDVLKHAQELGLRQCQQDELMAVSLQNMLRSRQHGRHPMLGARVDPLAKLTWLQLIALLNVAEQIAEIPKTLHVQVAI